MLTNKTQMLSGANREFRKVIQLADTYAASPWPVLLLGETGVGKELFAQRMHERSDRREGAFVPVNCGALPPGLFESELFGHERGSFSGAQQSHRGLIRSAQGGTLFLDEIGDLDLALQVKLLRLLDTGEFRSVGANKVERCDIRLVAATNVDLTAAVRNRRFRQDLLERLSVLTIRVPALRDRPEDIPVLASHFLDQLECAHRVQDLVALRAFPWPGNVRQLRNFLIRASVQTSGALSREVLDQLLREDQVRIGAAPNPAGGPTVLSEGSLADIEKRVIVERLRRFRGNRKRTARELGIAKSTLHEKLRRWKLESPEESSVVVPARDDIWSVPDARCSYAAGMAF